MNSDKALCRTHLASELMMMITSVSWEDEEVPYLTDICARLEQQISSLGVVLEAA